MARTDGIHYKDMKMLFALKKLGKNLHITADYFKSSPGKVGVERNCFEFSLFSLVLSSVFLNSLAVNAVISQNWVLRQVWLSFVLGQKEAQITHPLCTILHYVLCYYITLATVYIHRAHLYIILKALKKSYYKVKVATVRRRSLWSVWIWCSARIWI